MNNAIVVKYVPPTFSLFGSIYHFHFYNQLHHHINLHHNQHHNHIHHYHLIHYFLSNGRHW